MAIPSKLKGLLLSVYLIAHTIGNLVLLRLISLYLEKAEMLFLTVQSHASRITEKPVLMRTNNHNKKYTILKTTLTYYFTD